MEIRIRLSDARPEDVVLLECVLDVLRKRFDGPTVNAELPVLGGGDAPPPPPPAIEATKDMVAEVAMALAKTNMEKAKEILQGFGVSRVAELSPEQYPAVYYALRSAVQ